MVGLKWLRSNGAISRKMMPGRGEIGDIADELLQIGHEVEVG